MIGERGVIKVPQYRLWGRLLHGEVMVRVLPSCEFRFMAVCTDLGPDKPGVFLRECVLKTKRGQKEAQSGFNRPTRHASNSISRNCQILTFGAAQQRLLRSPSRNLRWFFCQQEKYPPDDCEDCERRKCADITPCAVCHITCIQWAKRHAHHHD